MSREAAARHARVSLGGRGAAEALRAGREGFTEELERAASERRERSGDGDQAQRANISLGSSDEDMQDASATCDMNTWSGNIFGSSEVAAVPGPHACLQ
jgi:hypothetical protein